MKGAKYTGVLAVMMAVLVLGTIPAVAIGTEDAGARERKADEELNGPPVEVVRGMFAGNIYDEDGVVKGRVLGKYIILIDENGTSKGRFSARWNCEGTTGIAKGVMRDGEFKGVWRENLRSRRTYRLNAISGDGIVNIADLDRPHYGRTSGKYALGDDGILMRGRWVNAVTNETGFFTAKEYSPSRPKVGRFKGVWIKTDVENETADAEGTLYGIYVKNPYRTGGRFGGRWTLDGEAHGMILGHYRGGHFKGIWTTRGGIGGFIKGSYGDGTFEGRWFYRDGTLGGYLKGEYGLTTADDASGIASQNGRLVEAEV